MTRTINAYDEHSPSRGTFFSDWVRPQLAYIAWAQALIATLGSLFFSEIMRLTPCTLCWYQRILMYPLVVILAICIARRDPNLRALVLPFSLMGVAVAVYHNLLYYGILSESLTQCTSGVSCTQRQIEWFGFITIPLLSLIAFSVITLCIGFYQKVQTPDE